MIDRIRRVAVMEKGKNETLRRRSSRCVSICHGNTFCARESARICRYNTLR